MHKGQYVVQRGLHLARIGGAPFDVRVLLQKSVRNKWTIQSMVARVAELGNVVSNVADGGHILHPRRAIALAFGGRINSRATLMRLKRITKATAHAIESEVGFELAEMGVDLGIDASAKIWVIEANSRPGRETGEARPQRISRSVQRLVSFLRSQGLQ
ncbi:MAG: Endospore coat-associated protein YheD [Firmicutes bacterium]|nr:Endospore coat-associated protein YheD [Bacillota bacterium]